MNYSKTHNNLALVAVVKKLPSCDITRQSQLGETKLKTPLSHKGKSCDKRLHKNGGSWAMIKETF